MCLIGRWWFLTCLLALKLQEVENYSWNDVACWIVRVCNAKWFRAIGLIGKKCVRAVFHLFSQPQNSTTVECRFGAGLQFLFASELKQVLRVKLKFVLEFKMSSMLPNDSLYIKINSNLNTVLQFNCKTCSSRASQPFFCSPTFKKAFLCDLLMDSLDHGSQRGIHVPLRVHLMSKFIVQPQLQAWKRSLLL